MTSQSEQASRRAAEAAPTPADLIDRLVQFTGEPREFLVNLLAVQCRLSGASAGAILRAAGERFDPVAMFPPLGDDRTAPTWLAQAVESAPQAAASGSGAVLSLHGTEDMYGAPARRHLLLLPLRGSAGLRGAAAFVVESASPAEVAACRQRLEMTLSLLSLYEMRLTLQHRQTDLRRLRAAVELSATVSQLDRAVAASMAACNEIASRWRCERVSLGFLKGRYVHLKATSHTEKFSRRMKLAQDIEAAMEECIDQDVEVAYPAGSEDVVVNRAAEVLSRRHGPTAAVSFPLRVNGEPAAVLTAERPPDAPLSMEEVESLRLACDLCTPHLVGLHRRDRWVGARAAEGLRKGLAAVVGPRHTWAKLAVLAAAGLIALAVFTPGDYRVEASFVLKAPQREIVAAPWDGFLKSVAVEPGDPVVAGETTMAELDDSELRLHLAAAEAERVGYVKSESAAMRDGKTSDAQIARAEIDKIDARIRLLRYQIDKARIVASITGTVIAGDLTDRIGAPVKTGDVLFEIAPLTTLQAELYVPEDQIAEVEIDQVGELATAGFPQRRVRFTVERISPVAELVNQRNVFKVRARLQWPDPAGGDIVQPERRPEWMHLGEEGLAKIQIRRERLIWLWTRKLVNWLRMKLWI